MKHTILFVIAFLQLFVNALPPVFSPVTSAQGTSFRASVDSRRTLNVEGTDAAEAITLEVSGEPASVSVEYRSAVGDRAPRKESFRLDAFDRLAVNARGGNDFVNIIDAAGLLDAQKKAMRLEGGEGDNVVAVTRLPFEPATARRLMRLQLQAGQIEGITRRAAEAATQALTGTTLELVDAERTRLAEPSKAFVASAERQLFTPARDLLGRSEPQLNRLSASLVARSEEFTKRQAEFVDLMTKQYDQPARNAPPDDDREPPNTADGKRDDERPAPRPEEKGAADAQARATQLAQAADKSAADARAQAEAAWKSLEGDTASIEKRASETEKSAEQLNAAANSFADRTEKELTDAAERVTAAAGELKSLEGGFRDVAAALDAELRMAVSSIPEAKKVKPPKSPCLKPIVTSNSYTGGGGMDFFFPFMSPTQSWSINGGAGGDILFGGFADDDIRGGDDNDWVFGFGGNDQIHGDDGTDFLFGDFAVDIASITGDDCIWGGKGLDFIVGDNFLNLPGGTPGGADELRGEQEKDFIVGDDVLPDIFSQTMPGGDDTIDGGDDTDLIWGGGNSAGKGDIIDGGGGIDFVEGNGGGDTIDGGGGQSFPFCNTTVELGNLLLGGYDDDTVKGGSGIDVILGNPGMDTLKGGDQIDFMFGGKDRDLMRADSGGTVCVIDGIPVRIGNLLVGGPDNDEMWAGGDLDVFIGQGGDDEAHGYDGSFQQLTAIDIDLMIGNEGEDKLYGDGEQVGLRSSHDIIIGGPERDELYGGEGSDFLFGGDKDDVLSGDSNALWLASSTDLLVGGDGDDWGDGGNGLDVVIGGSGHDKLWGDNENPGLISSDIVLGGDGNDYVNGGDAHDILLGGNGNDQMLGDSNYIWQPMSGDIMLGNDGDDYMDGGNHWDLMFGGRGCDRMLGDNSTPIRVSNDVIFGEEGDDTIDGGNGLDFIFAGSGNDTAVGDPQNWWQVLSVDFIFGEEGCDTLLGGSAPDLIWGGPGVDHIEGQHGPDLLFGGGNSDTISGGAGLDLIWGNEGNDLIHGDDFADLIWGGDGDDCLYGDDGPDLVFGDSGADCIHGGSHADLLFGNDGDDLLFGDNGPDMMWGGDGDDNLDGGGGADIMFGGGGTNELWGGPGLDLMFGGKKHQSGGSGLECNCQIESCTGRVCVRKFNDLNGNGIQDPGEPGLPNWAFQLSGSCAGATLTTDANGDACADFFSGSYTATETLQPGWTATTPTTQTANVAAGQSATLSFGNRRVEVQKRELCIYKFHDRNGNGAREFNETLLSNWSFTVTDSTAVSTTVTTGPGGGMCRAFPIGATTITEILQPGWVATTPATQTVTLTTATPPVTNIYFGNRKNQ
ncbi:MAG TPA: hypothetical protein VF588_14075 [Pyrinomonadaceae bacterium]|jgi:Ca2+-binding RTX toxin-like protein